MRKLFFCLFIVLITMGYFMANADAARFGGGRSFGMSRSYQPHTSFNAGSVGRTFQTASGSTTHRWLGPLAGFAAGSLLTSLFMGHGIGSGLLSWLLLGGLVFFVWRFISKLKQPVSQPATRTRDPFHYQAAFDSSSGEYVAKPVREYPAGFDEAAFLRRAKTVFIRLQADYDNKNILDIQGFTTPEVFAEIQMQLHERGDTLNQTEVISINAELQDIVTEGHTVIASVLFSGLVREDATSAPTAIKEIWHLTTKENTQDWVIAGIQQV
ncbi:MAG: Transrane protein [Gammaproteobacteria bacterium]|jgi:predicted lipid-binding transport protein (Tim44 family)|nr:Transrane protein [Gammaproteobacteria bacterium]